MRKRKLVEGEVWKFDAFHQEPLVSTPESRVSGINKAAHEVMVKAVDYIEVNKVYKIRLSVEEALSRNQKRQLEHLYHIIVEIGLEKEGRKRHVRRN